MLRPLILLFALFAGLVSAGRAQNVDIRSITRTVTMGVTAGDFNPASGLASVTSTTAIVSQIRSRLRPWNLDVRASSSTFTHAPAVGAPSTTKSVSNLLIRESGTSAFGAISTTDRVVSSGAATNNTNVNLDLRFDTSLNDSPGSYATTLIFTIYTL